MHSIGGADWGCLVAQTLMLLAIVSYEVSRPRGRNLLALLTCVALLTLVVGQTWWMFLQFSTGHIADFTHLNQYITIDAARTANWYVCIAIVCFAIPYTVWSSSPLARIAPKNRVHSVVSSTRIVHLAYVAIAGLTLCATAGLIWSAGGIAAALTHPGLNWNGGVTMMMLVAGIGKLPYLHKLTRGVSPRRIDLALFALAFGMSLLNSRFIAAFILIQSAIIWNYCVREITRRTLGLLTVAMFLVFIVFGLYRHFTSLPGSVVAIGNLMAFASTAGSPIDWFYRLNIEGFAGLGGILTYQRAHGGLTHDFGLSSTAFVFQFVPNALRADPGSQIGMLQRHLTDAYPYPHGSVISPGLEIAYAHF